MQCATGARADTITAPCCVRDVDMLGGSPATLKIGIRPKGAVGRQGKQQLQLDFRALLCTKHPLISAVMSDATVEAATQVPESKRRELGLPA